MVRLDNRKDFDKVWELMQQSFPQSEMRSKAQHETLLDNPHYVIWGEWDETEHQDNPLEMLQEEPRLKAFIATYDLSDFLFIDYFAAHPDFRGQGIGRQLLHELLAATDKNICLEIEVPEDELTRRRRDFYARNGFILCEFPHLVPPVCRGNVPIRLSLMSSQPISSPEEFQHIHDRIIEYTYRPFL